MKKKPGSHKKTGTDGRTDGKKPPRWPDWFREQLPIIRFVVVTLVSLVGLFMLLNLRAVERSFVTPYTIFVAETSRIVLRLLGVEASGVGTVVSSPQFSVNILNVCNGLEVTAIFFATVLGFPATWKNKLIGLAIGYPVIYLINLVRIIVLFFLGFKQPDIFETVHYYYAQAFVILATVGVWLIWVSLYSVYGSKTNQAVPD
jgi:exosortase H (IPTLxxWG-CTERM-specific)